MNLAQNAKTWESSFLKQLPAKYLKTVNALILGHLIDLARHMQTFWHPGASPSAQEF